MGHGRHVPGCFLNPVRVSRPTRTALSKSSTLTMRHREMTRECMLLIGKSLSLSGSNQAREGRLVNALAVRGDEGRDTLR